MCWQKPCGFQPVHCVEPQGIFWKATAFLKLNIFIPLPKMAIRPAVFKDKHTCLLPRLSRCQQKIFEIAGKVSKKAEMEIFFALNFRVPSSRPSPVFAPPPCSAGSLEVWAHDLSTDLSGDSVCLGAVGQGVPLVHAVPATTQRWAWRDPSGQGWNTLLVFTLIWLCSGYDLFF